MHGASFKASHTPGSMVQSKMPQRPGSSKPIQKGGTGSNSLLGPDKARAVRPSSSGKRPESPNQQKTAGAGSNKNLISKNRIRPGSPNTQSVANNQVRAPQQKPPGQIPSERAVPPNGQPVQDGVPGTYKLRKQMGHIPGSAGLRQGPGVGGPVPSPVPGQGQ